MARAKISGQRLSHPLRARRTALSKAVAAAVMASAGAAPVVSQDLMRLEEIIVTATKRSQTVQNVPLAISAFSGEFSKAVNLNDVKDLVSFTPGVTGNSQDSFIDAISVRGIRTQDFGVGGDPSAAFFKNELYEGRNGAVVTSLYDMERSEILRGPQGFLFGRNSIGGAFSVHTKKAEIDGGYSGYVDFDFAERNHIATEGAINLPVSDSFAMRLAGYYSTEDGFVDNKFDGDDLIEHDKWALRWSTAFESGALSASTTVEYETREQSGSVYRAVDRGATWDRLVEAFGDAITLRGGEGDADVDRSRGDNDDADILSLGVRIDYEMSWATLTSNTGYKDHDYYYNEDYDGTPLNINNYRQDQEGTYFQQELRLTSNTESPFSWYAGVAYYDEDIDAEFANAGAEDSMCQYYGFAENGQTFSGCSELYAYYGSPFTASADGMLVEPGIINGDYKGWGAYVDLTYSIADQLDLSVGVRYSDDEKDFTINVPTPDSQLGPYWAYQFSTDGDISDTQSWDDVQMRLLARYTPTDSSMFFASYTEGFKSGGFGSFALNDAAGNKVGGAQVAVSQADGFRPNPFEPETVDSYEIGYKGKGSVLGNMTNVSLTAFYYEYEDLQVVVSDSIGSASVENAGEVEGLGLEGTVRTFLGDYFDVYIAASWLDSEANKLQPICGLDDINGCEGSSLFWAPEFSGAVMLSANFPTASGAITGSLEMFFESERGGGFEDLDETKIDAYQELALRVGYAAEANWSVGLYVENLTDEFTYDGMNNNGALIPAHFFGPKRPRTFGINFGYEWD